MYDYLIVGAGLFGAVFAHEASKRVRNVLLLIKEITLVGMCILKILKV